MNKVFDIHQVIYEANKDKAIQAEKKNINNARPYAEALSIIKNLMSKNHAAELSNVIESKNAMELVRTLITKYIQQNKLTVQGFHNLSEIVDKMYEDMAGFGFLTKYIYDDEIEEINGNSWRDIEIVTPTGWRKLDENFISSEQSIDIVKKMCQLGGVIIDGSRPTEDSYITKGVRISAIIPPCVDDDVGAVFSIRKQKTVTISKNQLITWNTATDDELDFLNMCLSYGVSLGIAGATGSGKTTDISYLLKNVPKHKRIYSIEDTRELDLISYDENGKAENRVIHTKTRFSDIAKNNVDADVLLKRSLRFHPDIISPAEMRGQEAMTAQEAGRTGHTIITSLHASTALAAYTRILTMCMMSGTSLSEELMLKLIIEAFPIMVFKKQLPDKTRKYMRIFEAEDFKDGKIIGRTLYKYIITGREMSEDGKRIKKMEGYHMRVNPISNRLANIFLENGADIKEIKRFANEDWQPEIEEGEEIA